MARFLPVPLFFVAVGLVGFALSCQHAAEHVEAGPQEEPGVRVSSYMCLEAVHDRDIDRLIGCFAEDASVLAPSEPTAQGIDQVRESWSSRLANPGYNFTWQYTGPAIGHFGAMAYETGTYEMTVANKKGKLTASKGKFLIVWKKPRPGQWRIAAWMLSAE